MDMRDFDPRDTGERVRNTSDSREALPDDPRDVVTRDLDLPRGPQRERVDVDGREYKLRGSEVRTLATIGAFRVVAAADLRDDGDHPGDLRHGDLEHLRREGLVRSVGSLDRHDRSAVLTLTKRGRAVLEAHRRSAPDGRPQAFYAEKAKLRELSHDARVYQAYLRVASRLHERGARVLRVVVDDELKREYQRFLQDGNKDRSTSEGRPTRSQRDVEQWAREHDLPMVDGHVQFPDVRLEYVEPDGRREVEDVEVLTPHYRGAHAAAKSGSGFTGYRIGSSGANRGAPPFDPDVAAEVLR